MGEMEIITPIPPIPFIPAIQQCVPPTVAMVESYWLLCQGTNRRNLTNHRLRVRIDSSHSRLPRLPCQSAARECRSIEVGDRPGASVRWQGDPSNRSIGRLLSREPHCGEKAEKAYRYEHERAHVSPLSITVYPFMARQHHPQQRRDTGSLPDRPWFPIHGSRSRAPALFQTVTIIIWFDRYQSFLLDIDKLLRFPYQSGCRQVSGCIRAQLLLIAVVFDILSV